MRIEVGPRDLAEGLVTLVRRDTGEKRPGARRRGRRTGSPTCCPTIQDDLLAGGHEAARRPHGRRRARSRRPSRRAKVGFARIAWDLIKDGGEDLLARDAITVRCLQTADGGLPTSEDDPDLIAYVARSY